VNDVHFHRGSLLYQQWRYAEAIGELQLQLAVGESFLTHGLLALCLAHLEKFPEATEHAQRAIHLAPDESFGHYALAQIMLLRNRLAEAQAAIEEAIRLAPYDADHFAILGSVHLRASRWKAALEAANQGLQIDPEHQVLTNLRAQALVKLGDRAAAAATIGEALARRPDDPYTHANQGWALLHQGDPYKAMEHFREALRLNPELEWARLGIVEALKARNILYRWMLGYFLWMARLPAQIRTGLMLGAFAANWFVGDQAAKRPALAPLLWPLLLAYFAFVLMSWLSYPLFNLLLRLDKFGRHALSTDQRRGANVLAACLAATLGCLVWFVATGNAVALYGTIFLAILALPASAIYICTAGWPRRTMTAITLGLLALVLVVLIAGIIPEARQPKPFTLAAIQLMKNMPYLLLGAQFAAIYLMGAVPKK